MGSVQYFLQYFVNLFVIISPLAIIALFVSMTAMFTPEDRIRTARVGSLVAYGAMLFFALTGKKIFEFLGISMGAFYIAGGAIIFLMGLSMLNTEDFGKSTGDGTGAVSPPKKSMDIAATPFGIPIVCGPCCITGVIALQSQAVGFLQSLVGFAALTAVGAVVYVLLVFSARGAKWLTPAVLKLSFKLSGLILAALAVQMIV
ncbi:MAG: MarC family protein, partial [Puniceicoccales bacterium]|nr:MarC family protein [Puniceicoccales bacterium]